MRDQLEWSKSMKILPAILTLLLGGSLGLEAKAQVLNLPTDYAGIVALQERQLKEEMEFRKAPAPKDPAIQLDALPDFIRLHPAFLTTKGGVFNAASEFSSYIKRDHPDATAIDQKLLPIHAALKAAIPQFYAGMFDSELSRTFLKENIDLSTAKELAQSGINLYDQGDCLQDDRFAAESHHVYDEKAAKHPVPFTYHSEEGEYHCAKSISSRYAMLGKVEAKLGETTAAAANFQTALQKQANVDAALGLAKIDKEKGDKTDELEMLSVAFLTGAVSPDDVKQARALYAELNPGATPDSFDKMLDARYAKTYVNPVTLSGLVASATQKHVVLEELFTGADCEPCVAPDLATDAVLHQYRRNQVVVAVFHDNAPGPDPLTTITSEARAKFYGTGGSTPHVFLDGKEVEIEEGPPSHAQSSFEILTKAIAPLLVLPSSATLHVALKPGEDKLTVEVTGSEQRLPPKTHLQILLLETEVSDTGKNTLRFQPMVVRAAARVKPEELGIPLRTAATFSQDFTFDLKKIEADNLAYYGQYREELEARLAQFMTKGYVTRTEIAAMAQFREPKNLIHSDRLAVVAFLQADDSKEVFQTVYAALPTTPEGVKE